MQLDVAVPMNSGERPVRWRERGKDALTVLEPRAVELGAQPGALRFQRCKSGFVRCTDRHRILGYF